MTTITGTEGDDTIVIDEPTDSVSTGSGSDTVTNNSTLGYEDSQYYMYVVAIEGSGDALTVINNGTIFANNNYGLDSYGDEANYSYGIRSYATDGLTVTNNEGATISGGFGAINSVSSAEGAQSSIENHGEIESGYSTIRMFAGGDVFNDGTITSDGSAAFNASYFPTSTAVAIYNTYTSTVENDVDGVIQSVGRGVYFGAPGQITNRGLIEGGSVGINTGTGTKFSADDVTVITNYGTIRQTNTEPLPIGAEGGNISAAIRAHDQSQITNDGQIEGMSHGIRGDGGLNVVNNGTIIGDADDDGEGFALLSAQAGDYIALSTISYSEYIPDIYGDRLSQEKHDAIVGTFNPLHLPEGVFDGLGALIPTYTYIAGADQYLNVTDENGYKAMDSFTYGGEAYDVNSDANIGGYLITNSAGDVVYQIIEDTEHYDDGRHFIVFNGDGSPIYIIPEDVDFSDEIANTGTINGDIGLGLGDDTLVNSGTITGSVSLQEGNDHYNGQLGSVLLDVVDGGEGNDTLRGNDGNDTLDGGAGSDVLSGGAGNDEISGGDGNDIVWAGDGDDNITGGDGDDQIGTGAGNDVVDGGAGANLIFGADGNDTITLSTNTSTAGNGVAWGGNGNDEIYGGSGDDRIGTGNGNDAAEGGAGDDTLYGGSADYADELDGGSGDDELYGGGGGDALEGGSGDDVIWGGAGDDTITGGAGDDEISGGPGSDELIFTSGHGDDVVASFSVGDDMLDLSGTNTNFTSAASVQAAASNTTVSGDTGVMIDTGGGDSIFLIGITTTNLLAVDYTF